MERLLIILGFFFLLCFSFVQAEVVINEIMYNPSADQGDDADLEWVELYNNGTETVNLTAYTLDSKALSGIIQPGEYVVVARDNASFISFYQPNYTVLEVSISLTNSEDSIVLTNGSFSEILNYSSSWGANGDGYSLERVYYNKPNVQDNWKASLIVNGTPGAMNNRFDDGSMVYDYSVLSVTEFLANPQGDDSADLPDGEWVEIYNDGIVSLDLEGFYLEDEKNNTLIITSTNMQGTFIPSHSFGVVYRNGAGGFSLNNEGYEEIKLYADNATLIDKVSYSYTTEGQSWMLFNNSWIQHLPSLGAANIFNEDYADSTIEITNIYDLGTDKKAKWGQTIRARVEVYKGETTKNQLKAWIGDSEEKLSKVTTFNVYDKFTVQDLTIPLQLIPNCNEKYDAGAYPIYIEGFDVTTSLKIDVQGITDSLCEKVLIEPNKTSNKVIIQSVRAPEEISQESTVEVSLMNEGDVYKDLEVWSYVYTGKTVVSGEKEANLRKLTLPPQSSTNFTLKNFIDTDVKEGDYKLKVVLQQEGRKTPDEFVSWVKINPLANAVEPKKSFQKNSEENSITGDVVYASSDVQAQGLGIYLFTSALLMLVVYLLFKKTL